MTTRRAAVDDAPARIDGTEHQNGGMALLNRATILAAEDIRYAYVEVPEWGGSGRVRVRSLTGTERDQYDAESFRASQEVGGSALANFRVRRVARAIVNENGDRVFADKDVPALGAKHGGIIDRIDDVVVELSGMAPDSRDKAKADLKAGQSDGSGSA